MAPRRKNSSADWGEIEIHLRRSTDGGRSWSDAQHIAHLGHRLEGNPHKAASSEQTVNNPVSIIDRVTGSIEFLYCVNYARCYSMRSADDGLTWSKPIEGEYGDPNETMITETSDERVMLVSRNVSRANRKLITTSADGATHWSKPVFHIELWEPICMASIISHPSKPGTMCFPILIRLDSIEKAMRSPQAKGIGRVFALSSVATMAKLGRSIKSSIQAKPRIPILPCCLMEPFCVSTKRIRQSTAHTLISNG